MKKNLFHLLNAALALLLCLSVLASCGRKASDGADTSADTTAGEEVTTSKPRPVLPSENIPPLDEELAEMDYKHLEGYSYDQLKELWGHPVAELFGFRGYVWQMPDDLDYVIAYFDEDDYVIETYYQAVFKATVVSVSEDNVTIAPASGEKEAEYNEVLSLPLSSFKPAVQETLTEGVTVYVEYSGTVKENHAPDGVTYAGTANPLSGFARY